MAANLENPPVGTGLEKVSFHSSPKEGQYQKLFKLPHNLHSFHTLARYCSKSFKRGFKSMWTSWKLPGVQPGFRRGRGTRDQIGNIYWIIEKARKFQKTSASLTTLKPLTVRITTDCGKFFKRWEYQAILRASWKLYASQEATVRTVKQQTGSKLRKEYIKALYCLPAYLTYVQSTSCEIPGWMNHLLESRLLGEISITSDMRMTPPLWQKVKKN